MRMIEDRPKAANGIFVNGALVLQNEVHSTKVEHECAISPARQGRLYARRCNDLIEGLHCLVWRKLLRGPQIAPKQLLGVPQRSFDYGLVVHALQTRPQRACSSCEPVAALSIAPPRFRY